jgi:hypothetical protein
LEIPDIVTGELYESKTIKESTSPMLLGSYLTESGYPGVTQLAAGDWTFYDYFDASVVGGVTTVEIRVYKYTALGAKTLLFSGTTAELNNDVAQLVTTIVVQNEIPFTITDRLIFEYWASTTNTSNVTVRHYHNGTLHASHVVTPIPAVGKVGATGPTGATGPSNGLPTPPGTDGSYRLRVSGGGINVSWEIDSKSARGQL